MFFYIVFIKTYFGTAVYILLPRVIIVQFTLISYLCGFPCLCGTVSRVCVCGVCVGCGVVMFSSSPSKSISGCHEGSSPVSAQVCWCWVSDDRAHVSHGSLCGPVAKRTPGQSHRTSFFRDANDPELPRAVCRLFSGNISTGSDCEPKPFVSDFCETRDVCWMDTVNDTGHLMLVPTG